MDKCSWEWVTASFSSAIKSVIQDKTQLLWVCLHSFCILRRLIKTKEFTSGLYAIFWTLGILLIGICFANTKAENKNIPQIIVSLCCWFSVIQSCLSLQPHGLQHARLPCPSPSPRTCSNSCPLSLWCHPTILSSVIPFSCFQSFPASGSFLESALTL